MHIILLGGSNTGMQGGWAAQFVPMAQTAHHWHIENRFLGAVGSLYGVLQATQLLLKEKIRPDFIIFEYMLNDIILANNRVLSPRMTAEALEEIASLCAQAGAGLHFLCLEPRYWGIPSAIGPTARIRRAYQTVARRSALSAPLMLQDILGRRAQKTDYLDDSHFTPAISRIIAECLLAHLTTGDPRRPPRHSGRPARFAYVDTDQATTSGPAERCHIDAKVFRGPFLKLPRGAAARWSLDQSGGSAALAGILICSDATSGFYQITADDTRWKKNAHSQILEILPRLVLLHYMAMAPVRRHVIEISMPAESGALMALPIDSTVCETVPPAAYDAQVLYISGLLVWRGARSFLGRSLEWVEQRARRYWRRKNYARLCPQQPVPPV